MTKKTFTIYVIILALTSLNWIDFDFLLQHISRFVWMDEWTDGEWMSMLMTNSGEITQNSRKLAKLQLDFLRNLVEKVLQWIRCLPILIIFVISDYYNSILCVSQILTRTKYVPCFGLIIAKKELKPPSGQKSSKEEKQSSWQKNDLGCKRATPNVKRVSTYSATGYFSNYFKIDFHYF